VQDLWRQGQQDQQMWREVRRQELVERGEEEEHLEVVKGEDKVKEEGEEMPVH